MPQQLIFSCYSATLFDNIDMISSSPVASRFSIGQTSNPSLVSLSPQSSSLYPDISYGAYLRSGGEGRGFSNFVGSLFGGYENWANSQLAQYQNWYDSPAHQAQMYQDAGFNRNLITSQATGSSQAHSFTPADFGGNIRNSISTALNPSNFLNLASALLDLKSKDLDNKFKEQSLPSRVRSAFYQSGQKQLEYDWNAFLQSQDWSDAESFGFLNSPKFDRYQSESLAVSLLNGLRTIENKSKTWQLEFNKKWLPKIEEAQLDLLEGKKTLQDIDIQFAELYKEMGIAGPIARLLLGLIR